MLQGLKLGRRQKYTNKNDLHFYTTSWGRLELFYKTVACFLSQQEDFLKDEAFLSLLIHNCYISFRLRPHIRQWPFYILFPFVSFFLLCE